MRLCGHRQGLRLPHRLPTSWPLSDQCLSLWDTGIQTANDEGDVPAWAQKHGLLCALPDATKRCRSSPCLQTPHYTLSDPGRLPSPRDSQACALCLSRYVAGMQTLAELKAALHTPLCALEATEHLCHGGAAGPSPEVLQPLAVLLSMSERPDM